MFDAPKQRQEAETNVIEHHMFDAATLGRMLEFIYTGAYEVCPADVDLASTRTACGSDTERHGRSYTVGNSLSGETNPDAAPVKSSIVTSSEPGMSTSSILVAHAHVYAIAEYYDVAELKTMAAEKFKAATKNFQVKDFVR